MTTTNRAAQIRALPHASDFPEEVDRMIANGGSVSDTRNYLRLLASKNSSDATPGSAGASRGAEPAGIATRAAAFRALPEAFGMTALAESLAADPSIDIEEARAALRIAGGIAPDGTTGAEGRGAAEARSLLQPQAVGDPYVALQDARAAETARIERDGATARAANDKGAAEARALLGRD